MRSSKIIIVLLVFLGFTFMGYQCGSTELTSAKLYIQQKNLDKAQESLENEVQKNPKSDEGYYLLGYVYGEKEQYDKMIDAFNKALAISNTYAEDIENNKQFYWVNLFNKGVKAYQEGVNSNDDDSSKVYLGKAANYFEYAVKIQPDSLDSYKNLAFVHLNAGNYDMAIDPLEKMIEKEKSLDGYRYLGEILYEKGSKLMNKYNKAQDSLLSADNSYMRGSTGAEDSLQAMETFEKAIKILEEGRKVHSNDPDILLALSNVYIAANKLEIAKDVFKAGVETEPENKYYRYNYGVLLLGAELYDEAVKQFSAAVEIDPEYENALYNLGVTYVKWGTHLNEVAEEKGETSSDYREKYRMALPHLEKVVQMKSEDASLWELLGKVYTVLDMQEDATNAFKKSDQLRQ
jgi:tetratricopeptide (TPR) repeat protein